MNADQGFDGIFKFQIGTKKRKKRNLRLFNFGLLLSKPMIFISALKRKGRNHVRE